MTPRNIVRGKLLPFLLGSVAMQLTPQPAFLSNRTGKAYILVCVLFERHQSTGRGRYGIVALHTCFGRQFRVLVIFLWISVWRASCQAFGLTSRGWRRRVQCLSVCADLRLAGGVQVLSR